jgi:hypothetical protein
MNLICSLIFYSALKTLDFKMPNRCDITNCGSKVLSRWITFPIAYILGAIVLSVPFLNAAGASIKNSTNIGGLDYSWTAILIGMVWLVSGFISAYQKHEHIILCAISACGVPGFVIGLAAFLK